MSQSQISLELLWELPIVVRKNVYWWCVEPECGAALQSSGFFPQYRECLSR